MSLLARLEEKAVDTLGDGHWVDKVADELRKQGDEYSDLKPVVDAAADELVKNKDKIGKLSAYGFTAVTARLALGDEPKARALYLRHNASFREMMDALDADDAAARAEKQARDQAWADVKSVCLSLLKAAGKAAIPLLLAVV